ncbi:hypothetical protein ACFWPP_10395 [Streptomyces anulatus]|uniref:hypothetical protein n=1 Tax=Streptomyces anulatus TaxID=1892 RepID=UPI00365FB0B0
MPRIRGGRRGPEHRGGRDPLTGRYALADAALAGPGALVAAGSAPCSTRCTDPHWSVPVNRGVADLQPPDAVEVQDPY